MLNESAGVRGIECEMVSPFDPFLSPLVAENVEDR